MKRFTALLPGGGEIAYGLDATIGGFWAEVRRPGRKKLEYDALHPGEFNFQRPLEGLLYFLVARAAVFSEEDLHDALGYFQDRDVGPLSPGAALAFEVLVRLKAAAD